MILLFLWIIENYEQKMNSEDLLMLIRNSRNPELRLREPKDYFAETMLLGPVTTCFLFTVSVAFTS